MSDLRRFEELTDGAIEKARRIRETSDADELSPPPMPRPRAREITPVLSLRGDQPRKPWAPPEEKPLRGMKPTTPEQRADADAGHWVPEPGIGHGDTVLHAPSGVVGVVKRVHGPNEYLVKPAGFEGSGRPVSESVVELEDGNAFLFRPGSFVVLNERAAEFHGTIVSYLSAWTGSTTRLAGRDGVEREVGLAIVRAVLAAQLRALSPHATAVHREANEIPLRRSARAAEDARREADEFDHACVVSDEVD